MFKIITFTILSILIYETNSAEVLPKVFNSIEGPLLQNLFLNCDSKIYNTGRNSTIARAVSQKLLSKMKFHYFVGDQKITYKFYDFHDGITNSTLYDRSLPMFLIVYTFMQPTFPVNFIKLRQDLVATKTANVFILDERKLFVNLYTKTVINSEMVAAELADVLTQLYNSGIRNFHLLGLSLSGHTCGLAAKIFEKNTSVKINRITALDPAGPCFKEFPSTRRLASTDADFVDVIHTNNVYGIDTSLGHVDFYVNGGQSQVKCKGEYFCSHAIVGTFYRESITSDQFIGVQCPDWNTFTSGACAGNTRAVMGFGVSTSVQGNYYIRVNDNSPYAMGENGLQ